MADRHDPTFGTVGTNSSWGALVAVMTETEILMPVPMLHSVAVALGERFAIHRLWEQADRDAYLASAGPRIRGLVTSGSAGRIGDSLFDQLPALEIVANFGVGYDNIDVHAAARRGIVVTNTPGVLDEEVADLAVGLLLATVRQIPQADRFVRDGQWPSGPFPLSASLRNRQIGVLGLGAIGKAIARRLDAFGVPISYHGRSPQAGVRYEYLADPVALAEAVSILIVAVPGGAATCGLIDASVLAALGPTGMLINVSRGSVVDQPALIDALRAGTIAAAGLDVFADEPHVPSELREMDNVVLLPHVGSASEHTRAAMGRLTVENLASWFECGRPISPVGETWRDS